MRFSVLASSLAATAVSAAPEARGQCRSITVQSGDSCASLAHKCGISGKDFLKYNKANLCSTLVPKQRVCCSSGSLRRRDAEDETSSVCKSYDIKVGDTCYQIATSNGLTVDDLYALNKETYGWAGCKKIVAGQRICIGAGEPPLPAPVNNAVCGPQVPGTKQPAPGTDLSQLNKCANNACCNIWGQCGSTDEFCVVSRGETGNPGTTAPGKSSCISNCRE